MKKLITTTILILFAINLMATVYWVSPTGTDAATGRTRSAAWQTLDKVSAEMQSGDIIRFKRSATWNDTLFVNASNVQLIAWGEGREPVIQYVYIDTVTQSISFQNITVTNFLYPAPPEPDPEQYPETYSGTIYYVSNDGSDSNDGTKSSPFASIDKVNTLTLAANDAVLFNSEDSFEGTVTVGQSGTSGNPITIGAYGIKSSKPKIYGSEVITGWTLHSGNIYKATFATDIQQLFVDGDKMQVARLTNSGYNTITGVTSQTVIATNAASQADNYYVGCKVITRSTDYHNETKTVTASSGNTLTLNSTSAGTLAIGQGVLIMNKLEFLDSPGEWYYDTATNTVYLWTPNGDSPAGYEVRGSTLSDGISISNKSYITINNIDILHQIDKGIEVTTSTNNSISITNCNIAGQGNFGICADPGDGSGWNISNNTISDISSTGIYGYRIGNSTISNNTINNIGLFESWGTVDESSLTDGGSGIEFSDPNLIGLNTISDNIITNTGYNGIFWRGETLIQNNFIQNVGLAKGDGGGIYTGSPTSAGSVVSYNIVDRSVGSQEGYTKGRDYAMGIYIDEGAINVTVQNNVINDCHDSGIFLHKPYNHTVQNNLIFDCRYNIQTGNTATGTSLITNNIAITGKATDDYDPRQLLVKHTTTGVTYNNNTYVNGFASDDVFNISGNIAFAAWQSAGYDAASTYDGTDLSANETQRIVYNSSSTAKTFYLNAATSVKDENMDAVSGSFVLQPFTGKYVRGLNLDCILDYSDAVAPTVSAFTIPASSESLVVEITEFTGSEGTTGYLITESATTPTLLTAGWSSTAPATFTASGGSSVTLYAWVRDAAGNISSSASDATTLPDLTANLLANYYFTETSGTVSNDLIGSADGTIYGTPAMDGAKFTLDGTDDYISFPLPTVLNSNQYNVDFSINIKFTIFATPEAAKRLFTQSTSFTRGIQIVLNTNRDIYGIITENDGPVTSGKLTSGGVSVDIPHNLTVTWEASVNTLRMYLDGTEITGTTSSNSLNGNTAGMRLGSNLNAAYINADVYELSVFDKKLSDTEVTQWINR